MTFTKIDLGKLEKWCNEIPECCKFMRIFFNKNRERVEMHKTLESYMESIATGMQDEKYAKQFDMSSEMFKFYHSKLMDAFHGIVSVDYGSYKKPTVVY